MAIDSSKLSDSGIRSLLGLGLSSMSLRLGDVLSDLPTTQRADTISAMLDDLNLPIGDLCHGPLSLQRLTGITEEEVQELKERDLLSAISEPGTSKSMLLALCEFGELMQTEPFPIGARLAGVLLTTLTKASLRQRHAMELSKRETDAIAEVMNILESVH